MKGTDWDEAYKSFERANKRLEENSVNYYKYQLRVLIRWAESQSIALERFQPRHFDTYHDLRKNIGFPTRKVSAKSLIIDYDTANVFFRFCVQREFITRHPFYNSRGEKVIFRPKKEEPLLKTPDHGELSDLLDTIRRTHDSTLPPPPGWKANTPKHTHPSQYVQAEMQAFYRTRDIAIVEGLICSGLRSGELLSVRLDDYEPRFRMEVDGHIYIVPRLLVRKSKSDTPIVVYMTPEWGKTVKQWLDARHKSWGIRQRRRPDLGTYLFISRDGSPVDSAWWTRQFTRYKVLACQKGYRTHDIRHRVGEDVTRSKGIYAAQQKLNHRDIRSTLIYARRNEADLVKLAIEVDSLQQVRRAYRK